MNKNPYSAKKSQHINRSYTGRIWAALSVGIFFPVWEKSVFVLFSSHDVQIWYIVQVFVKTWQCFLISSKGRWASLRVVLMVRSRAHCKNGITGQQDRQVRETIHNRLWYPGATPSVTRVTQLSFNLFIKTTEESWPNSRFTSWNMIIVKYSQCWKATMTCRAV